jgi:raffinose/stachyose/melibiose transport system permease protein
MTPSAPSTRRLRRASGSAAGWLYLLAPLAFYAAFVLYPIGNAAWYSLFKWSGVGLAEWVGFDNYARIFTDPQRLGPILNSLVLVVFFTVIPIVTGLALASLIKAVRNPVVASAARTVLFLPQIIPLVAAGIGWTWLYSETGLLNQVLTAVGLESITRAWLGDFDTALPAVGLIGSWVMTGFCVVFLLSGMGRIDPSLFESLRLDGGGWFREFRAIILPGLRNEIAVLITVTVISALSSFDIVFTATQGGPGRATSVPGVEIYRLAFGEREVGMASAIGIVLMLLVVLVVLPVQRLIRESD